MHDGPQFMLTCAPLLIGAGTETGLLLGLLLVAAIVGGYTARLLRVPKVVGFLIAGTCARLALNFATGSDPESPIRQTVSDASLPLKSVKELGLGLIVFSLGGVFVADRLRPLRRALAGHTLAQLVIAFPIVALTTAGILTLVAPDASATTIIAFSLLLGATSIATAPAATVFVLREYEAKGGITDAIMVMTGLNSAIAATTFYILFWVLAAAGFMSDHAVPLDVAIIGLSVSTVASLVLGICLGFALSILHATLSIAETLLILVAAILVVGAADDWLLQNYGVAYNTPLTILTLGATFFNLAIDAKRLDSVVSTFAHPILVGFFVIAGFDFNPAVFADAWPIALTYLVARTAGKFFATRVGVKWGKLQDARFPWIGSALLCHAAVALGLADFIDAHWDHPWAAESFSSTIVASVVIFEIVGPILIKRFVVRAGEVKAVTLLRHTAAAERGTSPWKLAWSALVRLFRPGQKVDIDALKVRHVMRPDIATIRSDSPFDDVLSFVEHARTAEFPVVDENGALVGVIHYDDISQIIYNPALRDLVTAADMTDPTTRPVSADMKIADALTRFQDRNISALPVVESEGSNRVIGFVEQRDLLRALHRAGNHD